MARTVGPRDFGAFTLAFATYVVALSVTRAISAEPLLVRYSKTDRQTWQDGVGAASGLGLAFGILAAFASLIVAGLSGGTVREAFLALAVSFPGLLVQDIWRYAFFASGRGKLAFATDFVWALILFPVLGFLILSGRTSVLALTLAWGMSGSAAALFSIAWTRVGPQPHRSRAWLTRQRDLVPNFLAEMFIQTGGHQLMFYGAGAISGLAAAGSLRAAYVLLAPISVMISGLRLVAIPEAAKVVRTRRGTASIRYLKRSGLLLCAAQVASFLVWGTFVYFWPEWLGTQVLGKVWEQARDVVLPLSLASAAGGLTGGASAGLRALAAAKRSRRARTILTPLQLTGALVGMTLNGPVGAAWGLGVASIAGSGFWWWQLLGAFADYLRGDSLQSEPFPEEMPMDVAGQNG